jgi:hypothetical protein
VNPQQPYDGIPHVRRAVAAPLGGARPEENWTGANAEKDAKLRVRSLQRRARSQGIQIRHSASGYALFDAARKPVNDRNDLTVDEVEAWLDRG